MNKYSLFKIKPGKRKMWVDWCKKLMGEHFQEGIVSIIEEDLVRERCIIFGEGDESYVFYEHITLPGKDKKLFNPKRQLNLEHRKMLDECLDYDDRLFGDIGYDFKI